MYSKAFIQKENKIIIEKKEKIYTVNVKNRDEIIFPSTTKDSYKLLSKQHYVFYIVRIIFTKHTEK